MNESTTSLAPPHFPVYRFAFALVAACGAGLLSGFVLRSPGPALSQSVTGAITTFTGFMIAGTVFMYERRPREVQVGLRLGDSSSRIQKWLVICSGLSVVTALWLSLSLTSNISRREGTVLVALAFFVPTLMGMTFWWLLRLAEPGALTSRLFALAKNASTADEFERSVVEIVNFAKNDFETRSIDAFRLRLRALNSLAGNQRTSDVRVAFVLVDQIHEIALTVLNQGEFGTASCAALADTISATSFGPAELERAHEMAVHLLRVALDEVSTPERLLSHLVRACEATFDIKSGNAGDHYYVSIILRRSLQEQSSEGLFQLSEEVFSRRFETQEGGLACQSLIRAIERATGNPEQFSITRAATLVLSIPSTTYLAYAARNALTLMQLYPSAANLKLAELVVQQPSLDDQWESSNDKVVAVLLSALMIFESHSNRRSMVGRAPIRYLRMAPLVERLGASEIVEVLDNVFDVADNPSRIRDAAIAVLRPSTFGAIPSYFFVAWIARQLQRSQAIGQRTIPAGVPTDLNRVLKLPPSGVGTGFMRAGLAGCGDTCANLLLNVFSALRQLERTPNTVEEAFNGAVHDANEEPWSPFDAYADALAPLQWALLYLSLELNGALRTEQTLSIAMRSVAAFSLDLKLKKDAQSALLNSCIEEFAQIMNEWLMAIVASRVESDPQSDLRQPTERTSTLRGIVDVSAIVKLQVILSSDDIARSDLAENLAENLTKFATQLGDELVSDWPTSATSRQVESLFTPTIASASWSHEFYEDLWDGAASALRKLTLSSVEDGSSSEIPQFRQRLRQGVIAELLNSSGSFDRTSADASGNRGMCPTSFLMTVMKWLVSNSQIDIDFAMRVILASREEESDEAEQTNTKAMIGLLERWCDVDGREGQARYLHKCLREAGLAPRKPSSGRSLALQLKRLEHGWQVARFAKALEAVGDDQVGLLWRNVAEDLRAGKIVNGRVWLALLSTGALSTTDESESMVLSNSKIDVLTSYAETAIARRPIDVRAVVETLDGLAASDPQKAKRLGEELLTAVLSDTSNPGGPQYARRVISRRAWFRSLGRPH